MEDDYQNMIIIGLKERIQELEGVLEDMANRGLRFDLNPTHNLNNCEEFWHSYIKRADESIRERAAQALKEDTNGTKG